MSSIPSKVWAGWFQDVYTAVLVLGGAMDAPMLGTDLLDGEGLPTKAWGAGFFQKVNQELNPLLVAALLPMLPPPQLLAPMLYDNQKIGLRLAWVGWTQAVHDSILNLGGTITAPPLGAALLQ